MLELVKDTEAPNPDPASVTGVKEASTSDHEPSDGTVELLFGEVGGMETGAPTGAVGEAVDGGTDKLVGEDVIGGAPQVLGAMVAAFTTDGAFVGGATKAPWPL